MPDIFNMRASLEGLPQLLAVLDDIPERVQTRVFRLAGRKASAAVAKRAKELTPRRNVDGKDGLGHLQDRYDWVQRIYRTNKKTVFIVGSKSGRKNRINHLVEFGTNNRWTGHKTRRVAQPNGTYQRTRRVKTASGGWRTVREVARKRDSRVSVGSFRKFNYDMTPVAMMYRGRMPAFHQLALASKQVDVNGIVINEFKAGLQRIADRNARSNA